VVNKTSGDKYNRIDTIADSDGMMNKQTDGRNSPINIVRKCADKR